MKNRPYRVFLVICMSLSILIAGVGGASAIPVGDALTLVQRPLLNIPAIVTVGDTLKIECDAGPDAAGWAAELIHGRKNVPLTVVSSVYDPSTLWWEIEARVPTVPVYELYDLAVTAAGGLEDTTWHAVRVIPQLKDDYYFIHITDTHLPTHLYYYERGADTDSSEVVDLREIIHDVNIINPEFVLLTGDLINEGELEDYLGKRYFSRSQRLLREFEVPVYLTAGNHDIGGWKSTPPPDGTARRTWWKFFGWRRCDNPPPGAPWYTQNYSFDYGPVHYVGLEAYDNYDSWRYGIYGADSFTSGQMTWLADDIGAASGSAACVLFYHYDFSYQINLASLGADMALSGHVHRDYDDFSHPYDIITNNACDGERSYRLVRVSGGVLEPSYTVSAGPSGNGLAVEFTPANDGTHYSVTAEVKNNLGERFEHSQLRFVMPNEPGTIDVTGGRLLQVDDSGPFAICYVAVDILPSSLRTVTVSLYTHGTEAPIVAVTSPNGIEIWESGSTHDITWTATDDVGVTSVTIVLSVDGGVTYSDTLATGEANDGVYPWTIEAEATSSARIKVIAYDGSGNSGEDASDGDFEISDATTAIPSHLVITGTFPNPTGRRAAIGFGLPRDGWARIDMYDVSGRFVMNLVGREYLAGYHSLDWEHDGTIPAGLYFLRLRAGSDTATSKIVVTK